MDASPQSRTTEDTAAESNGTRDGSYRWHAPTQKYETPRPTRPVKPKSVTINSGSDSPRSTENSSKAAFKLKFHKKPMYSRDKKAKESALLTPRPLKSVSENSRPKSFHLERDHSIYRTHTYLWEEQQEDLTYFPSTNTQTDVMLAYTGEPNSREALKSANSKNRKAKQEFKKAFTVYTVRPKKPPWHEKEYVLNRREAQIYQGIKQVYDRPTGKKARQRDFMKKLQQFQVQMAKHDIDDIQHKEQSKQDCKVRQAHQLKELRQRFEDEAWHRFHTQYVTSRVLEHEKMNRFQYGLPEEPGGETEFAVKLKRKKKNPHAVLNERQLNKLNKKKYADMFDVNTGPKWNVNEQEPKMEGIDTVVLDIKENDGKFTWANISNVYFVVYPSLPI